MVKIVKKERNCVKMKVYEKEVDIETFGIRNELIGEELKMKKTQLGKEIGISGQFLGLVESGKGNLVYKSVKKLMDLSGHSADYILYGLDDSVIKETKKYLEKYTEKEIIQAMNVIKEITLFIKE